MLLNGLYAVEMKTLDGVNAVATGITVARDGVVMGGDPYFYYTGTYSVRMDALEPVAIKSDCIRNDGCSLRTLQG
jgi:hypothetical protein